MERFDIEGRQMRLLKADKEANAFVNYKTEHKRFIPWTAVCMMYI